MNIQQEAGDSKGWFVRVGQVFLDAGLSLHAQHLLLRLEMFARSKDECFPSNQELKQRTGWSLRQIQKSLAELELAGWIRRSYLDPETRKNRNGIMLIRRAFQDLIECTTVPTRAHGGSLSSAQSGTRERMAVHQNKTLQDSVKTHQECVAHTTTYEARKEQILATIAQRWGPSAARTAREFASRYGFDIMVAALESRSPYWPRGTIDVEGWRNSCCVRAGWARRRKDVG